jgi:hypothetical protein
MLLAKPTRNMGIGRLDNFTAMRFPSLPMTYVMLMQFGHLLYLIFLYLQLLHLWVTLLQFTGIGTTDGSLRSNMLKSFNLEFKIRIGLQLHSILLL